MTCLGLCGRCRLSTVWKHTEKGCVGRLAMCSGLRRAWLMAGHVRQNAQAVADHVSAPLEE